MYILLHMHSCLLQAKNRVKLNFLEMLAKFWELQVTQFIICGFHFLKYTWNDTFISTRTIFSCMYQDVGVIGYEHDLVGHSIPYST